MQTPAILMIAWCCAVELASYPSSWHKEVSAQVLQPRASLGCAEGVLHDLRFILLLLTTGLGIFAQERTQCQVTIQSVNEQAATSPLLLSKLPTLASFSGLPHDIGDKKRQCASETWSYFSNRTKGNLPSSVGFDAFAKMDVLVSEAFESMRSVPIRYCSLWGESKFSVLHLTVL